MKSGYPAAFLASCLPWLLAPGLADGQEITFSQDIQPIFRGSCLECHGPEKQKGKLRLDRKEEAFKTPSIIVPGDPAASELYKRITLPRDHDDFMPAKGDPLSKAQTDRIRDWIDQGAAWPDGLVITTGEMPLPAQEAPPVLEPAAAEQAALSQLQALGVQARPIAMNAAWSQANLRGINSNALAQAMSLLSQIITVTDLNLAGTPLRDEDLKPIAGLTNLTRLHLEKTPITDAGLVYLKDLAKLRYLNLYHTQITDAGLDHLHSLKELRNLFLWQTQVTDQGVAKLQSSLPNLDINRGWEIRAAQDQTKNAGTEPKKE